MEDRYSKIEHINHILFELATGNFDVSCEPSDERNEFDALIVGINMLREELLASTVSKNYLQSIYNGIIDMLIIVDIKNDTIEQVNDAVHKELGFSSEEVFHTHFSDLIDHEKSNITLKEIQQQMTQNKTVSSFELWFQTKKGTSIPTSCSASFIYNKEDEPQGILYTAKNIFLIKETERKLIEKNKELDTFVYKSSHDLKGPLSSIIGLTNIADMEIKDEVALRYFSLIRQSAERLQNILVDLSELARLRNSAHQVTSVNMKDMVEGILGSYLIDNSLKKEIDFQLDLEDTPLFESNEKIIRSIIQNLIDNAIKYRKTRTMEKPFINMKLRQHKGGNIKFVISDNGLGIRADKVDKVFDMFLRANETSKGTGLGLYIVKTSVQKLNGTITVQSIEREGTTFSLSLPKLLEIKEENT